jgi:putative transposase
LSDDEASLIRASVNKAWILGDDRFKQQIERQLGVSVSPKARGGDRKSIKYQKNKG